MSSEHLKKGDLVYSGQSKQFYVIHDCLEMQGKIAYECHTYTSQIELKHKEDLVRVASYEVTSYDLRQLVYAWHEESFEQARVIGSGPRVRFVDSHVEKVLDSHWIYPMERFLQFSSFRPSQAVSIPFFCEDQCDCESGGGIKDSEVSDSEGEVASGYDTDRSSPPQEDSCSKRPDIPAKVLGVFARFSRIQQREKDTGIVSDPEDVLQYDQLDSCELLSGIPASHSIIETNHGRAKTGKRRGAVSPGSICSLQFNGDVWTVYGILITTNKRKQEGYVEYRLAVLYTTDNNVGIWCKAFKCHPDTTVGILNAPRDVQNVLVHYACSFHKIRKRIIPKDMELLPKMDANYCVWCRNVEIINPQDDESRVEPVSLDTPDHEPLDPIEEISRDQKRKKPKKVCFSDENEIFEISRRQSFEYNMPLFFSGSGNLFLSSLNGLRGKMPEILTRQFYRDAFRAGEVPSEVQGFLPDHLWDKGVADVACSFLLPREVSYYSIVHKTLNEDGWDLIASLLKSRGDIFAVVAEKSNKRIHLLSGQGRFFMYEPAFKKSTLCSKLKTFGEALGLQGYSIYVYETPEQYHNEKMKWEHSCVLLYVLSHNLLRGSDDFWTVQSGAITADLHNRRSCLYRSTITDFTYSDLKLYLMNLTFAALTLVGLAGEQNLSKEDLTDTFLRYYSYTDSEIANMAKQSLRRMNQRVVLFYEPTFVRDALQGLVERYKNNPNSIPLTHFLACMVEHITGSKQRSTSPHLQLLEIGIISRRQTAISFCPKSDVKIHHVGTL